jgi:hypothetical protein
MANIKNYSLIGVGQNIQFAKGGANLQTTSSSYTLKASDGITNASLTAGVITSLDINISNTAGTYRTLDFQTGALDRWLFRTNNTLETGSDVGSDLELVRVADDGTTQNLVYRIARNTGIVNFTSTPTINGVPIGSGSGTVTSVAVSGGSTGLTTSGGPVTGSGTITLAGTLGIANGGTGQITASAAINALLPTQTGHTGQFLTTDGTNVSWAAGGGGGGTPGGADTQIQYNDSGTFGGNAFLTVNKTTGAVTSTSTIKSTGHLISDVAGTFRNLDYQTSGLDRWLLQTNSDAETGADSGSNFDCIRVADNGTTQNIVYSIARNTGILDFKTTPTVNGSSILTNSSGVSLTSSQVGFGSVSNTLAGSANFIYDNANIALSVGFLKSGFNTSTNAVYITTDNGAFNDFFINPVDIPSSNAPGQFVIRAANNNSGFPGGTLTLRSGNNSNSANAGDIIIDAGNATGSSGNGGSVIIQSGTGITSGSPIIFSTAATTTLTERLRILASGAWSVGPTGTDVGTAGYVLTSNGAGTPPTWSPSSGGGGGVTSVNVSGGTTGLTTSGGPITTSGTITLAGTLGIANGGTGQTTSANAINALVPSQSGNGGKFLTTDGSVVSWGTAGTVTSVSVTTANGISGSVATATTTPAITLILGAITPTSISSARINPRTASITTATTITPTGDTVDVYYVTALASAATIAAPSGTPVAGQKLMLNILDNGSARALTWTTTSGAYRAVGVTLPVTTVAGKEMYIGCIYNANATFWDVIAIAQL